MDRAGGPRVSSANLPTDPDIDAAEMAANPRELLLAATRPGATGSIVLAILRGGGTCTAGGRQFMADFSKSELARWMEAVDILIAAGLVRSPGPTGTVYDVTAAGFELANRLRLTGTARAEDTAAMVRQLRQSGYMARPPRSAFTK
jgi:hypothetical protein